MNKYRDNGAIGALLDEYEKALEDLYNVIEGIGHKKLITIADKETLDSDCVSIQSVLIHVLRAGYNYIIEIRRHIGEDIEFINQEHKNTISEYIDELTLMFNFNEKLFIDYPNIQLEEYDEQKKMHVRWDQKYDVEQLMEHAIVHILRHRRQIERFLLKLNFE